MVQDAVKSGAKVVVGGTRGKAGPNFYQPTLLTGVNDSMRVVKEEIFGPVMTVIPFDDEKDVLAKANDTGSGLAA